MFNHKKPVFWTDEEGKIKISHSKLIDFIGECGYIRVKLSDTSYLLANLRNNRLRRSSEGEIVKLIKDFLVKNEPDLLEDYTRNVGSYLSSKKMELLETIELINDRDETTSSNFFFLNYFCQVTATDINILDYNQLNSPIWENRILNHEFNKPNDENGQFENFCKNIAGNDETRFKALKSLIGYLLHRNKDKGEPKAVILYDEKMGTNNQAHGGTGKSLLSEGIKKCREVVIFNAKEIKVGSWFINQRIDPTTDLIVYDDLKKDFAFEHFFSIITGGIEVEKKRQTSFYIEQSKSPKILISSNYYVKGPGGSSDERRRYEFEIANYYDEDLTPEIEFGNRFFYGWDATEWNKFYHFMMSCTQEYLKEGLVKLENINLQKLKAEQRTSQEFIEFATAYINFNERLDKREYLKIFQELYPGHENLSPHKFTKWLADFAIDNDSQYNAYSSGGNYYFEINRKVVKDAS